MVIAGVLIWQIASIAKANLRPTALPSEMVAGGQRQPTGDVSVEVNYMAGKSDENKIVFEIILNTHSVDLDGIDFSKAVVMQKDGRAFISLAVEISGSGHHRSAELSFPGVGVPLKIVFLGSKEIERREFGFEKLL